MEDITTEVVFVGDHDEDHSPSSGYDQLCSLFPEAGWLSGHALKVGRLEWYRELRVSSITERQIFHVIYGDCDGRIFPALVRERFPKASIISSCHRPVGLLRHDDSACAALRISDAIITVSNAQAVELRDFLMPPTYAIPHGVWTNIFRPSEVSERTDVLLIGSFLRDWQGAEYVLNSLGELGIRCKALGAGPRTYLRGLNIEVLPRICESDLAALYARAAVVFLPFREATASNALLEAMAAGCPIVYTRLPALAEYLPDERDSFLPGCYNDAVARITFYVQNPSVREERSRELVAWSNRFDWSRLKHRYALVYEAIAKTPQNWERGAVVKKELTF